MAVSKFVEVKKAMGIITRECYENHKAAWESWENGEPARSWFDLDGNLCIEYENGKWWHYNGAGEW